MFSGKTEELIRRMRRVQIARQNLVIVKPTIDTRYSENHIVSHSQLRVESLTVAHSSDILNLAKQAQVVGIDEAQFFDDVIVTVCQMLARQRKRVVVAGLDKDFRGQPFGPMPRLMAEAEFVTKTVAICVICGNPAGFTQRLVASQDRVLIGETDSYEARCRNCFEAPKEET